VLSSWVPTSICYAAQHKPKIIIGIPDDTDYGDYACLGNPMAEWPEQILMHHIGRWARGKAELSEMDPCSTTIFH